MIAGDAIRVRREDRSIDENEEGQSVVERVHCAWAFFTNMYTGGLFFLSSITLSITLLFLSFSSQSYRIIHLIHYNQYTISSLPFHCGMSRYPSQGYPPPFPPPKYYTNPDHPIPYRGLSQGDPLSPTSNVSQATSKQDEENDKNAEDGGWSRAGPLVIEREKRTKQRGHKGMNSHDKTAIWLKTSQSGPSTVALEPVGVLL